jgi:hypothetical protein
LDRHGYEWLTPPSCGGITLDLTDDEAAALARYLRQKLDHERFPLARGSIRSRRFWRSLSRCRSPNRCRR